MGVIRLWRGVASGVRTLQQPCYTAGYPMTILKKHILADSLDKIYSQPTEKRTIMKII